MVPASRLSATLELMASPEAIYSSAEPSACANHQSLHAVHAHAELCMAATGSGMQSRLCELNRRGGGSLTIQPGKVCGLRRRACTSNQCRSLMGFARRSQYSWNSAYCVCSGTAHS